MLSKIIAKIEKFIYVPRHRMVKTTLESGLNEKTGTAYIPKKSRAKSQTKRK